MLRTYFSCVATVLLAGSALAGTISYDSSFDNTNFVDLGWATVTSSPRNFSPNSAGGYTGLGVSGGYVGDEIDLKNAESIRIDFKHPTVISEITLGFLFRSLTHGDLVNEGAGVQYGPGLNAELQVNGLTTANWTGAGTVTNLSNAGLFGQGVWQISDPFGNQKVSFLKFTALQENRFNLGSLDSDFALVSVSGTPTPEPSTWGMLTLGLGGMLFAFRNKLVRKA